MWKCVCGKENEGNFCGGCGRPAPVSLTKRAGWTCICGRFNEGKFCGQCGRSMPLLAEESSPLEQLGSKRSMLLLGGLFAGAFIAGIGVFFLSGDKKQAPPPPPPPVVQQAAPVPVQPEPQVRGQGWEQAANDLSLAGLSIGDSPQRMLELLGSPKKTGHKENSTCYYFDTVEVLVRDGIGRVTALVSDGKTCLTRRGLHEGSTLQEVLDHYGSNYTRSSYEDMWLYEYRYPALEGTRTGILRFAVKRHSNLVHYISIRLDD